MLSINVVRKCRVFIPRQNRIPRTSRPYSSPGQPPQSRAPWWGPGCQLAGRQKHHFQVQMLSSSKSGTNPTGVLIETITDSWRQQAGWQRESAAAVYFHKVIITRAFALRSRICYGRRAIKIAGWGKKRKGGKEL